MECNNGIVIPQLIEDPCNGKTIKASCVIDPTVYSEYSLSENSSQQQINQATYLSIQSLSNNASPTPDGSETKVAAGSGVAVTGLGTDAAPYVISTVPSISKTYSELTTMVTNNELIPGQTYLLTDYMTTYTQPVTNVYMESGVIEPLLLTAVSTDKFHTVCKSQLYPQDIVYYTFDGLIPAYNTFDLESAELIGDEGFTKGKIYRRIDTLYNNDVGTDWRHVKYRRGGQDLLLFQEYNTNLDIYSNPIRTINNTIKQYWLMNTVFYKQVIDNEIIGGDFVDNTLNEDFIGNRINTYFLSNTLETFIRNQINKPFVGNTLSGKIADNNIYGIISSKTFSSDLLNNTCSVAILLTLFNSSASYNFTGQKFYVNDALNPTFGSTVVGDGSAITPVFWNGANWIVG